MKKTDIKKDVGVIKEELPALKKGSTANRRTLYIQNSIWKSLRFLSVHTDRSISDLIEEAAQDLLKKHKSPY